MISEILEEENTKLKSDIHHLEEQREFDQFKLKEIMLRFSRLIAQKEK